MRFILLRTMVIKTRVLIPLNVMSSNCTYELSIVSELLQRFGMEDKCPFIATGEILVQKPS